jgi:hypothetical protein
MASKTETQQTEFNTEDTEKGHREHLGPMEKKMSAGAETERLISLWFSVLLCVLCVALFGI